MKIILFSSVVSLMIILFDKCDFELNTLYWVAGVVDEMGIESHRHHNEAARRRWGLLARALTSSRGPSEQQDIISVRRISNFGLVQITALSSNWYSYSVKEYSVKIRHLNNVLTPEDLMGFNNTGNICVWPSEEVLAYYVLNNQSYFSGKSVLELGGGMSCLAGLFIAKYTGAVRVHLTDGNITSVKNVERILEENKLDNATCGVLQWGEIPPEKYDVLLAADCLFFDDTRKELVKTMWSGLEAGGCGLITAPRRASTLEKFLEEVQSVGFKYYMSECYDQQVWERHEQLKRECPYYDSDIHYPVFIHLTKSNLS